LAEATSAAPTAAFSSERFKGTKPCPAQLRDGFLGCSTLVAPVSRQHLDLHHGVERLLGVGDHNAQTASSIAATVTVPTPTVLHDHAVIREALHRVIRDRSNGRGDEA
jgi:hypothetical protein